MTAAAISKNPFASIFAGAVSRLRAPAATAKAPTYDANTPKNSSLHLDQQVHALFMAQFHAHGLTLHQCDHDYLLKNARGDGPGLSQVCRAFYKNKPAPEFSFAFAKYNENPEENHGLPSVAVTHEGSDTILMKVFSVPDDYYPEDPFYFEVFFADISDDEKQALVDALGDYLGRSRLMAEAQLEVLNRLAGRTAAA